MKRRVKTAAVARPVAAASAGAARPVSKKQARPRLLAWLVTLALVAAAVLLLERALAPPLAAAAQEDELETFVPSEELPADAAVSFPVDI